MNKNFTLRRETGVVSCSNIVIISFLYDAGRRRHSCNHNRFVRILHVGAVCCVPAAYERLTCQICLLLHRENQLAIRSFPTFDYCNVRWCECACSMLACLPLSNSILTFALSSLSFITIHVHLENCHFVSLSAQEL